jgi:hypothetical protein
MEDLWKFPIGRITSPMELLDRVIWSTEPWRINRIGVCEWAVYFYPNPRAWRAYQMINCWKSQSRWIECEYLWIPDDQMSIWFSETNLNLVICWRIWAICFLICLF